MTSDLELLDQYLRQGTQDAFTALVEQHLGLVYSAALRQVRQPQLAEEIAQSVFTDLARQAGRLKPNTVLAAWLYQVTCRTAVDVIRRESRRQLREQVAARMIAMNSPDSSSENEAQAEWSAIEPLLDEAMSTINEGDRAALLLRYFQNKSLREVGQALGTNDDAAQKRVSRAVERLRAFFARRGITICATGLTVALSTKAVQAVPVGLALSISTASLAGTAAMSTALAATKTIAMTTLQKTLFGALVAAAIGTGIYEARQNSQLRSAVQSLQSAQAPLTQQVAQLQAENARLSGLAQRTREAEKPPAALLGELLRLRGATSLNGREIAELKAALASQTSAVPQSVTAIMNKYLAAATDQERAAQTNVTLARLERMSARLGLAPEQKEQIRSALLANAGPRAELEVARLSGSVSLDEINSRKEQMRQAEDAALASVLTPAQLKDYQQLTSDESNASAAAYVRYEVSSLKGPLGLTDNQAQQLSDAFATLKRGEGGPGITEFSNARDQLETRLRTFESILNAEQLQKYRQLKLADIEQHEDIPKLVKALRP
jgi:RNA polymerase sigma factor (sigma-70 family)